MLDFKIELSHWLIEQSICLIWIQESNLYVTIEAVDSVLRDGPWMIYGTPIFLNKWLPPVSLLKKELSHVPIWVKFHDVPLVSYTSNGLSLIATKIGADEEGIIEVTRKKSGGSNGGNKNFKPVLFKPKTLYCPKAKQLAKGMSNSPKTTSFIGTNKASTSVTGNMATTFGTQKERQSTTPQAKKINVFKKQMLEGKLVLVDDNWKQLEKVDYSDNTGSEDEIKPVIMKLQVFMHPN
nr:hypothetical protein [Tanacetum cinerariifolium]